MAAPLSAIESYKAGEPVRLIAERHAVTSSTVSRWARKAGLPPRPPLFPLGVASVPVLDAKTRRRLVARYEGSSETVVELARLFEISDRTVLRIVRAAGATRRQPYRPRTREEREQIRQAYEAGELSTLAIARQFGTTRGALHKLSTTYGWRLPAGAKREPRKRPALAPRGYRR
jgi:transposase-like protein